MVPFPSSFGSALWRERGFHRSLTFSLVLHLLLASVLLVSPESKPNSGGTSGLSPTAGRSAEVTEVRYLTLSPVLREEAAPRSSREVAAPLAVRVELADIPEMAPRLPGAEGVIGGEAGSRSRGSPGGAGVGSRAGSGLGGQEGGGNGGLSSPRPSYTVLPPLDRPASVRGKSFQVRFWVDQEGRVTRVEVSPQIPDAEYRRKFLASMYEYRFEPARRPDGTPVAAQAVVTITL